MELDKVDMYRAEEVVDENGAVELRPIRKHAANGSGAGAGAKLLGRREDERMRRAQWVLEEAGANAEGWGRSFVGQMEAQNAAYVLFVMQGEEFRVLPTAASYTFRPRTAAQPLTLEEAEQCLAKRKECVNRFLMRHLRHLDCDAEEEEAAGSEEEEEEADADVKDRLARLAGTVREHSRRGRGSAASRARSAVARRAKAEEGGRGGVEEEGDREGGLDYEEVVDDDEDSLAHELSEAAGDADADAEPEAAPGQLSTVQPPRPLSEAGRQMRALLRRHGRTEGAGEEEEEEEDEESDEEERRRLLFEALDLSPYPRAPAPTPSPPSAPAPVPAALAAAVEKEEGEGKKRRKEESARITIKKPKLSQPSPQQQAASSDSSPASSLGAASPPLPAAAAVAVKTEPSVKVEPRWEVPEITEEEIRSVLQSFPHARATTKEIIARFKARLTSKEKKQHFKQLMEKCTKRIKIKDQNYIVLR
jgi:transcription initiation factor TFIIF subunit alpha